MGSSYLDCNDNIIQHCRFVENCDGIELQYASNNLIIDCEFYQNTHAAIDAIGSNNNHNTVQGCTIIDNDGYGIYFSRSVDNIITQCTITNNKVMSVESKRTLISESDLETVYLLDDSSVIIQDCYPFDVSQITAINSDYEIRNTEIDRDDFDMEIQRYSLRNRIITILQDLINTIRLRIKSVLQEIAS